MNNFWIAKHELGLGFQRTNGGEERKREKGWIEMKETGPFSLLYKLANRVGSNPAHSPAFVAFGS